MLEREFASPELARRIVRLPSFHFIARTIKDNEPEVSESVTVRKKVKKLGDEPPRGAVVGDSIMCWGTKRSIIEKKVSRFLAS
jgi:hypothetical protein